ncbi:MAG: M4 family metallopeptidase, partial [Bacteroidia bacterium]
NMSNPNQFNHPDTYLGTNWFTGTADNGGVHTNSGVSNFWFYLLSTGGSGTNDINQAYSVSSLGLNTAARIAFRALTVYFTPTTNYAMARALTIKAATDLYGACSNEVIQTMNAWHAVGVGNAFNANSTAPNFTANITSFCSVPAQVNFSNTTAYALGYTWYFGDGTTSNSINPVHTYSANGTYTVKLKANGCQNITDSIIKNAFITIAIPSVPIVQDTVICGLDSIQLTGQGNCTLIWFVNNQIIAPIKIGTSVMLPLTGTSTTYYVANTFSNAPVTGGRLINSGGSYLTNAQQWQVFDVWQACTLNAVVVYANSAGNRTIELRSANNSVLGTVTASLSIGANTVNLNFHINPGTNYQLGLNTASASDLYRSNTGNYYPYNIGSCISITGS